MQKCWDLRWTKNNTALSFLRENVLLFGCLFLRKSHNSKSTLSFIREYDRNLRPQVGLLISALQEPTWDFRLLPAGAAPPARQVTWKHLPRQPPWPKHRRGEATYTMRDKSLWVSSARSVTPTWGMESFTVLHPGSGDSLVKHEGEE